MTEVSKTYTPFHIGLGSELLLEVESLKLRIKCLLVGMETGQYIIIRLSAKDLIGNFRSEHLKEAPLVVKYLYHDAVFGFKAELLNVVSSPAKMFILSYPPKIEEFGKIEKKRYECILPASAMLGNDIADLIIVDLSEDGCQCVIKMDARKAAVYNLLQVNKVLDIRLQFPGKEGYHSLPGKVRNISKGQDKILLGVQFEGLPQASRGNIRDFISIISSAKS